MRKAVSIEVTPDDRVRLEAITRGRNDPQKYVWRARIVLRIPPLSAATVDRVVALTNQAPPHEATHWTAPAMAEAAGINPSSAPDLEAARTAAALGALVQAL